MKIAVIGAGFGGMSAAAYLAAAGHDVTVYEKNAEPGGRATVIRQDGFLFDAGPSWYQMPDIYDEFFGDFGHKTSDFYQLKLLTPSYRVYFEDGEKLDVRRTPAVLADFERRDPGSARRLGRHLEQVATEYADIRGGLLMKSGLSLRDYATGGALSGFATKPQLLRSFHSRVAGVTGDQRLQHILEFMTVFLGGSADSIPGAYGLLNHVDMGQGVRYPVGGFGAVAAGYEALARAQGATFVYNAPVTAIRRATAGKLEVQTGDGRSAVCDRVVANADYAYVERSLLSQEDRSYSQSYWDKRTLSPSGVIGLLGVKGKVSLPHHALFFDTDWQAHFADAFTRHQVTERPLFYVCRSSASDHGVAPAGHENLFILIPTSNRAPIDAAVAERLVDNAISRIDAATGSHIATAIVTRRTLGPDYFASRFNATRGNAFGLAHTLKQTGPLRPRIQSKKLPGLFFVGQFTNPGTGVPLVTLSGKLVARVMLEGR